MLLFMLDRLGIPVWGCLVVFGYCFLICQFVCFHGFCRVFVWWGLWLRRFFLFLLGRLAFHEFFVEGSILAQDERWRRA